MDKSFLQLGDYLGVAWSIAWAIFFGPNFSFSLSSHSSQSIQQLLLLLWRRFQLLFIFKYIYIGRAFLRLCWRTGKWQQGNYQVIWLSIPNLISKMVFFCSGVLPAWCIDLPDKCNYLILNNNLNLNTNQWNWTSMLIISFVCGQKSLLLCWNKTLFIMNQCLIWFVLMHLLKYMYLLKILLCSVH